MTRGVENIEDSLVITKLTIDSDRYCLRQNTLAIDCWTFQGGKSKVGNVCNSPSIKIPRLLIPRDFGRIPLEAIPLIYQEEGRSWEHVSEKRFSMADPGRNITLPLLSSS